MTNISTDWRKDYWRARETEGEHAERVEAAEREARWYFERGTFSQALFYRETMQYLAPMRGPFWERKRGDALRIYRESTKEAAALFEETAAEHMRDGEVSEATSFKWDELCLRGAMSEAAE